MSSIYEARRSLGSDFTLGGESAEADDLLERAYYESGHYKAIVSRHDRRAFLIGRTGGGKSAAIQHLEAEYQDHVIRINPENLSLPYITALGVVKYLASLDLNLDPLFIALWKHVFLVEIIKHRYQLISAAVKQNFFHQLMDRIKRDPSKRQALEYLDEFEDRFWCETDERVRDIITRFEEQVNREARTNFGFNLASLGGGAASSVGSSGETRSTQIEKFQRIVNSTQMARLNKMMDVLNEDILDSPQNYTFIVIDDLDREWVDERVANDLIRCLFRAVLDLQRIQNLKILVALRTNIFEELNFGGRAGGQEEKFRGRILRMRWTKSELIAVLNERARVASAEYGLPGVEGIRDLIPATNKTRGDALEYILSRTLMRPRDAIAYFNECFVLAADKSRLTWDVINSAEHSYSYNRMLALRDEWKGTYEDIDKVFAKFRQVPIPMSQAEFRVHLDEAVLLMAAPGFAGITWMTTISEPIWNGINGNWAEEYHPLVRLLFNFGFVGCQVEGSKDVVYFYEDPDFMESIANLGRVKAFWIHPAFRKALDIV